MARTKKIEASVEIQELTEQIWIDFIESRAHPAYFPVNPPKVFLSNRIQRFMAYANHKRHDITLCCYTEDSTASHTWFETLLHEIAHLLLPRRAAHGKDFLKVVSELEHRWYPRQHGRWGMAGCLGLFSARGIGWKTYPCLKGIA